jgi:methylase of polypeptide subunit release factors
MMLEHELAKEGEKLIKAGRLTKEQLAQLERQLDFHKHEKYTVDIVLDQGINEVLPDFIVHPGVMRPELMTSLTYAQWFYKNRELWVNKKLISMGSGSGLTGIIAANAGAVVTFVDISAQAVANTNENIKQYGLEKRCTVVQADLFKSDEIKPADYIEFNHPFFPVAKSSVDPHNKYPVLRSMLGGTKLIHRFLKEAKPLLKKDGAIIMPYFHLLGETNNPAVQGKKQGYNVTEVYNCINTQGLHQGLISIYELRLK